MKKSIALASPLLGRIALITALAVTQLTPQRANAQAAAVVVPVGAAIVILGGIAYYTWLNSQGHEQLVPTSSAILEDPEEDQSEWDDPIIAASPEEAARECRRRAERDGVELVRVQPPSRVRPGQNQSYRCWFK
jgi:hypothetical protein